MPDWLVDQVRGREAEALQQRVERLQARLAKRNRKLERLRRRTARQKRELESLRAARPSLTARARSVLRRARRTGTP
jgi:cell division protein FtsB